MASGSVVFEQDVVSGVADVYAKVVVMHTVICDYAAIRMVRMYAGNTETPVARGVVI